MSEHAFRLIRKAKVGELDDTMRLEWDRLHEQRTRLEQEQRDYEEGMDAFAEALRDAHGVYDPHDLATILRIEDGAVYAEYCSCPACQAPLHGLTIEETVEKMFESNLLSTSELKDARLKAKSLDAKKRRERASLN